MPDPQAPEIAALADALRKLCERFGADDPEDEDTDIQAGLDAIAAYETSTTLPIAPQETMREALKLAANRLHRCAIDHPMGSREQIERSEWAQEARAALGQSHSPATVERELVEALAMATSDSTLYYLKSVKRSLDELNKLYVESQVQIDDIPPGPTLGGEVLADNRDWLDCHIDWLERTARKALATASQTVDGEGK